MADANVKVRIELAEGLWHGTESEGIWCEAVGTGQYRVRNIPFYAFNISLDDIIEAEIKESDGRLFFNGIVVRPSGNHAYRCMVKRDSPKQSQKYLDAINSMNCFYETAIHGDFELFSIDVPSDVDVNKVYDILERGEADGSWDFEEANYVDSYAK